MEHQLLETRKNEKQKELKRIGLLEGEPIWGAVFNIHISSRKNVNFVYMKHSS